MTPGERIRGKALELGFSMAGIAEPEVDHLPFYQEWIRSGFHGEMSYLARADALERRGDLGRTLEGVRSVVVVAHEYFQDDAAASSTAGDVPSVDPSQGIIARYARGADYHRVVKKKLMGLARWIGDEVQRDVQARAYVNTGPILERDLARKAGLG
ncbi:MAG: QueG-associated DUF1730 domain-containing protein, partial [Longimicrobiales bacterium]|nr:QueG-associated DUF1730 domain-containing protein [Longimicrobiales bacterium]